MISTLRRGLLVLLAALPLMANAAAGGSAHDLVQDTTNKMLADLSANKEKYKQDPSQFYNALNTIVGPVVDAEGISKSIMTVKYSRKATPEQMTRFQENFKRGLFQFYGNALLEYNNQGITVDAPKVIMPMSPWLASAGCTKNAVVPVLARVAAILLPTCPDLPMPTTTTRPLLARIISHARTKSASIWASKPSTASSSRRMVRCAD